MTRTTEEKVIKINYATLLTIIGLFGGAFAYFNNKYEKILDALGDNKQAVAVMRQKEDDTERRLISLEAWRESSYYDKPKKIEPQINKQ